MQSSVRLFALGLAVAVAALVGATMALVTPAARGSSQKPVLSGSLAPSVVPAPAGPSIFGVAPGGKPWVLTAGHVQLGAGGMLEADVSHLVVPATGSNPVPFIAASVYCGGTAVATTAPVPFSSVGNAQIHAEVSLPTFCPAPAVLLEPATGSSPSDIVDAYIAFDGMA